MGSWPPLRYVAGVGATLLAVWGLFLLLDAGTTPLFLFVVGILLAFLVHYPIDFFSRVLPRALATFVTLLAVVGLVASAAAWLLPELARQATTLVARFPDLVHAATGWWETLQAQEAFGAIEEAQLPQRIERQLAERIAGVVSDALPIAGSLFALGLGVVYVLGVAFFLAYRPSLYVEGLLRLVPRDREPAVRAFFLRLTRVVRNWLLGALAAMTFVATLTAVGTWLIGLESWLLLAAIAFCLEIVPFAGPILSAVPAVALALADSPTRAVQTALLYLAIQLVEGNAFTPIVMRRAIEIPPALLLLWQITIASAFGVVALFVAAPLLAALLVAVDHFYVRGILHKE